jgi:hypothetical protein
LGHSLRLVQICQEGDGKLPLPIPLVLADRTGTLGLESRDHFGGDPGGLAAASDPRRALERICGQDIEQGANHVLAEDGHAECGTGSGQEPAMVGAIAAGGIELSAQLRVVDHLPEDGVQIAIGTGLQQAAEGTAGLAQRLEDIKIVWHRLGVRGTFPTT